MKKAFILVRIGDDLVEKLPNGWVAGRELVEILVS
jgi:hypothetical protein